MRREKTTEILRHQFTPTEITIKAGILAQACQRLTAAEEEKKAAASQYTERITTEKALIGKTSREMNQGWETRPVDCRIMYNVPNTGIKSIVRIDTEEVVKTASMDQDELQETLFVDPQMSIDPEKAIEDNVRSFFGMKPAPPDTAPGEVLGWKQGEWIVVAASGEFAQLWMEEKGHGAQVELGAWEWCDPDTTIIKGLDSFFGTDVIPLRRAIIHMEKEGIAFPMLLQIPAGYMEKLHAGKDPEKVEPETASGPELDQTVGSKGKGKKTTKPRKPKPGSEPTVEPPAVDQEATTEDEGFGVDLPSDDDREDEDPDTLEPL